MSRVRDLFFDEFYRELEDVASGLEADSEELDSPPRLSEGLRRRWTRFKPDTGDRDETLISVDGGVQYSQFAYGGFVAVARAVAITHRLGEDRRLTKRVKMHVQDVYDNRDRGFIPGYARLIAEYDAARAAAEEVLEEGGRPLVLLDGSLYIARFPYAIREYRHHPVLLAELFESITGLRCLARDRGFPLAAVTKDSTVFYLHMQLLKEVATVAGLGRLVDLIGEASSPFDLQMRMEGWEPGDREAVGAFLDRRPLCDTALVNAVTETEGYTSPLLVAPSVYYGRQDAPTLYTRIMGALPEEIADRVISALRAFFGCPAVAVTYWKPEPRSRPFRVDLAASELGRTGPWIGQERNSFLGEGCDLGPLETVLNHLGHWFCNDVEYNVPLKQADVLARFDRGLYTSKYEPFIVGRLERAGVDIRGARRALREVDG